MDPTASHAIEAARAVVDAYRLAEELADGWEEALRQAVEVLAEALSELPQEVDRR